VEKYRSNSQYFQEKNYKAKILTRSIFKKLKSTKIILKKTKEKINEKKRKIRKVEKKVILEKKI
jgi:hypothetical protein